MAASFDRKRLWEGDDDDELGHDEKRFKGEGKVLLVTLHKQV